MRIGIIGSGNIGGTAARLLADAGHEVLLSNSRGPDSLADRVSGGVAAGTVEEAAGFGDVVLVAVPFRAVVAGDLPAERLEGRIVVDATNYYPARDGQVAELDDGSHTSSELTAAALPGARVVKAFNTMTSGTLASGGRPAGDPERLALIVAGDDDEAKRAVSGLLDAIGFDAVDSGSLAGSAVQQPGAAVYGAPLTAAGARDALAGA